MHDFDLTASPSFWNKTLYVFVLQLSVKMCGVHALI